MPKRSPKTEWFASVNDIAVLNRLIATGIDVNVTDKQRETLLVHAVDEKNLEVVQLLLQNGADANAKNSLGYSILIEALTDREIARELIKSGADTKDELIPLWDDSIYGDTDDHVLAVTNAIALGVDVNARCGDFTPLGEAICANDVGIVKVLLEAGADPNRPCFEYHLPLEMVLHSGNKEGKEIADLLKAHGAREGKHRGYSHS